MAMNGFRFARVAALSATTALVLAGCADPNGSCTSPGANTVAGGAIGALAGAAIGDNSRRNHGAIDSAGGAMIGATLGAIIGNGADRQNCGTSYSGNSGNTGSSGGSGTVVIAPAVSYETGWHGRRPHPEPGPGPAPAAPRQPAPQQQPILPQGPDGGQGDMGHGPDFR